LEQPLILALQSSLAAAAGVSAAAVKVELPPPLPGRRLRCPRKRRKKRGNQPVGHGKTDEKPMKNIETYRKTSENQEKFGEHVEK
jgi:hypothetical protein